MTAPVITLAMLHEHSACRDQVKLFLATFPTGQVEVTRETATAASEARLDVDWAARRTLRGPWRKAYEAAMAEPVKAYEAAIAEPVKAYEAAFVEAGKAYEAAMAEPVKAYEAAMAEAAADAFIAQCADQQVAA